MLIIMMIMKNLKCRAFILFDLGPSDVSTLFGNAMAIKVFVCIVIAILLLNCMSHLVHCNCNKVAQLHVKFFLALQQQYFCTAACYELVGIAFSHWCILWLHMCVHAHSDVSTLFVSLFMSLGIQLSLTLQVSDECSCGNTETWHEPILCKCNTHTHIHAQMKM